MSDTFAKHVCAAKQYDNIHDFYRKYGETYCPDTWAMVWVAKIKDDFNDLRRALEPRLSEKKLIKQYAHDITISFMGVKLKIPYDAVAYNALIDALNTIEKEL